MNCKDWEERLSLYAGGDLPKGEAAEAERHLRECPGCQMFSSGLKESQELLQELHREPLRPAHFAAVRARVMAELERERRPFWRRGWAFGVAAVVVVLLVMFAARSGLRPSPKHQMVAVERTPLLGPVPAIDPGTRVTPVAQRARPEGLPHKTSARPKPEPGEPLLIRMVSDNPDVVIYWIAETRGE